MKKRIFGHEVEVRAQTCNMNSVRGSSVAEPYINLYVRITNNCNAACEFCEFNGVDRNQFDMMKFMYTLYRLYREVKINKIAITGGEPTTWVGYVQNIVKAVKELDPTIYTVVNTNGYRWKPLMDYLPYIDSVALSRHHISDTVNTNIFDTHDVASLMDIADFPDKSKLHLSCNLMRGYVDSAEKAHEYIEHFSTLGVLDVGFVSLMQINAFCKSRHINFNELELESMPDTIRTMTQSQGDLKKPSCRCANFLTSTSNGSIVKSYARYYAEPEACSALLVFDDNQLKVGFNGKTIFK